MRSSCAPRSWRGRRSRSRGNNDFLLQVRQVIEPLPRSGEPGRGRRQLARLVDGQVEREQGWAFFDALQAGFLQRLREVYPELTPGDLRLAALLRMNLASKEVAPLLHLSLRGVENERHRLRKKLRLAGEENLQDWVLGF